MSTINVVKEQPQTDTPLLFFQCVLPSGDIECWSSHAIALNNQSYSARVLRHNLFDLQLSSDDAMDGVSHLSLTLANADSALSEVNSAIGFKGSQLTVFFAFVDLANGTVTTEATVLFRGIAGDPDEITEDALMLSFNNKLSLQRIPVPEVRIQRSCPWNFPTTSSQRTEALNGGLPGSYSRFYRCGYSADVSGGAGNLNAGQAFTSCDKSRAQCTQRGMFDHDDQGNVTRRFGGFEYVPSVINVRTAGDKTSHLSPLLSNSAKYNDPAPLVYGTGWLKAPIIFARNDGNLTHTEALLGPGPIQGVLKVVVNDIEIPELVAGSDMSSTGWFKVVTPGTRQGNFNADFLDSNGNPLGDPYGSLAVLSVVVPNQISSGKTLPNVEILLQGLILDAYSLDGSLQGTGYTNNPAWVILDILRRCGWSLADLNLSSFAAAAAFCAELIQTTDLNGNAIQIPRYQCNLILTKRQSAASVVRGIRVASSLMLRYGANGLLELLPETTIAAQQPSLLDGGNSKSSVNGGWPAYEFSDGSAQYSGIARNAHGGSTVILSSRSVAETSNRLNLEFQDESNEYQQDSLSVVNADDSALIGYEVSSQSTALGVANFSQATRVLLRQLDKSIKGNLFVQFSTSFRALKVRPGDIIAITYLKEGFTRALFRVIKLSPSMNYQMVTVVAQTHDDDWYSDDPAVLRNAGRQPSAHVQTPKPLLGTVPHTDRFGNFEYFDFKVAEQLQSRSDGSATDILTVFFSQPNTPSAKSPSLPLLNLAPQYSSTGGRLLAGEKYYYALSSVDASGREGGLSFTVVASPPEGSNTNQVTLGGLSFPSAATSFNVYRGSSPQQLFQIAKNIPMSSTFSDPGLPELPIGPPDASFDHANFYYRFQYAGPYEVDIFSATSIGRSDMGANPSSYVGMVVRIIEGTGRGQERAIAQNDATTLTVTQSWSTIPDASSTFVISESSWHFAAVSVTSPVRFQILYETGTVIQILGRAANVFNQESSIDLSTVTTCALGTASSDSGLASAPQFSLSAPGGGKVSLFGVGFQNLTNTESVSSGTLQVFYRSELLPQAPYSLAAALDAVSTNLELTMMSGATVPSVGQILQVDEELLTVVSAGADASSCTAARGALASSAVPHQIGAAIFLVDNSTFVTPFATGFFENRASQNYMHTEDLPDARICAAEYSVNNSFGRSGAIQQCYLSSNSNGLRTLSGGQFCIQVSGYLATQTTAAPPLIIDASHAVRDIRASLTEAASGYTVLVDLLQNGAEYCSLSIASGQITSGTPLDGSTLPPLIEGATISMNVTLQVPSGSTTSLSPGRDLTITVRL